MRLNDSTEMGAEPAIGIHELLGPSQYTAALIQAVKSKRLPQGPACEIGVGSGVCLLALAEMGFTQLSGCDVNPLCISVTRRLLKQHATHAMVDLKQGDLWEAFDEPVAFSVVLANLPHFPGENSEDTRMPHWRGGNGRDTMDRFLSGLPAFLAPGGVALITHHDLVGLQHTEELLATVGLKATCVFRWSVHENATRMASVTDVSLIENCPSAYQLGPYWFMDSRILRITHCD